MKYLLSIGAIIVLFTATTSCNFTDYEAKKQVIQDSLVNIFPNWQAAKIWIEADNTKINVVLGDKSLYAASAELKQQKTAALGAMIVRIFGKGNYLKSGQLIITQDTRNTSQTPADGISMPIPIVQ